MNFSCDLTKLLPAEISVINVDNEHQLVQVSAVYNQSDNFVDWTDRSLLDHDPEDFKKNQKILFEIIDKLGIASAEAQDLSIPVTTSHTLLTNQRIYILTEVNEFSISRVLGFLKIGIKTLYLADDADEFYGPTLCLLDFFIEETMRRKLFGFKLFYCMLMVENVRVDEIAIDCPSPKLLKFLGKHFKMQNPVFYPNRYITFPKFLAQMRNKKQGMVKQKEKVCRKDCHVNEEFSKASCSNENLTNISAQLLPIDPLKLVNISNEKYQHLICNTASVEPLTLMFKGTSEENELEDFKKKDDQSKQLSDKHKWECDHNFLETTEITSTLPESVTQPSWRLFGVGAPKFTHVDRKLATSRRLGNIL